MDAKLINNYKDFKFIFIVFPSSLQRYPFVFILKPGKDSALPSSYRIIICLLDKTDNVFEKILLTRVLNELSKR